MMLSQRKRNTICFLAILGGNVKPGHAFSFHSGRPTNVNSHVSLGTGERVSQALHAQKETSHDKLAEQVAKGFTALVFSIGAASQIAFANPEITPTVSEPVHSSNVLVSIGAPKIGGGSSFETLDFSMPSYDENTASTSGSSAEKSAPAFTNPFPELKLPEQTAPAPDVAAEKKAKEEAKVAEEKDKAEAKKAKEEAKQKKIAEEKAKQEEAEAKAKVAAEEKKRRIAEEKAKQEAAVKRAIEAKKAEEVQQEAAAPVVAAPPKAEAPKLEVPSFEAPKIEAPKVEMPKFDAPKFDIPKFEAPKFEAPKFEAPSISLPAPEVPKAPFTPLPPPPPKVIESSVEAAPAVEEEFVEPQEVRDEKAREARAVFKELDKDAKALEKEAKAARAKASEAKKEAAIAKGEACKTRPGGKLICLRPFGIGY